MGLFFYTKISSIISIGDLPTTNIIEPKYNSAMTKSPRKIWVINVMVVLVEDSDFVDQGLYLIVAYYC